MVGDIATPERRGRMMSTYQGFFLVGVGLGPTPGGILADAFGLRAPFIAYAVFSALACIVAMLFIRETRPTVATRPRTTGATHSGASAPSTPSQGLRATLLGAPFLSIGVVSFAMFFARTGALSTVVPLLAREQLGFSASQLGFALTAVSALNIVTLYPSGVLGDRFGRKPMIAPAMLVQAVSLIAWAVSRNDVAFMASALLWGLGSGISGPAPAAYVADLAPSELRGRIFGIFRSVSDAGYIAGPLLLGVLLDRAGYALPLLLTAGLLAASSVLFWLFAPEFYQPARTVAPEHAAT
jgi:MFS family permease